MAYTRNGIEVVPPADFYSTKNYTDSMIHFIDMNKSDKKPFFAYLSYTAVHDPLHTPREYADKYHGVFDKGWDSLWAERLHNLQALGIVAKGPVKAAKNPSIPAWNKLPSHLREESSRDMEVYAGMLDYMDSCIGVVLGYLKKEGMYDNTMIVFMSDNGANGAMATTYPGNADGKYLASFDNSMGNRGLRDSYVEMGPGWAQASSAPFRYFKSFTTEGGIKAPLIIKRPGATVNGGSWNASNIHVTDLMPTILELTGATYPSQYKGRAIHPLIGRSILPVLNGDSASVHTNQGVGWELFEMKAYLYNNWKILRLPKPFGTGDWQLFDIATDPAETTDLSAKYPERKAQLIKAWQEYARENQLYDHKGHFDSVYMKSFTAVDDGD
jgi:arylsulfatase